MKVTQGETFLMRIKRQLNISSILTVGEIGKSLLRLLRRTREFGRLNGGEFRNVLRCTMSIRHNFYVNIKICLCA